MTKITIPVGAPEFPEFRSLWWGLQNEASENATEASLLIGGWWSSAHDGKLDRRGEFGAVCVALVQARFCRPGARSLMIGIFRYIYSAALFRRVGRGAVTVRCNVSPRRFIRRQLEHSQHDPGDHEPRGRSWFSWEDLKTRNENPPLPGPPVWPPAILACKHPGPGTTGPPAPWEDSRRRAPSMLDHAGSWPGRARRTGAAEGLSPPAPSTPRG